jgi:hypothetical protein
MTGLWGTHFWHSPVRRVSALIISQRPCIHSGPWRFVHSLQLLRFSSVCFLQRRKPLKLLQLQRTHRLLALRSSVQAEYLSLAMRKWLGHIFLAGIDGAEQVEHLTLPLKKAMYNGLMVCSRNWPLLSPGLVLVARAFDA